MHHHPSPTREIPPDPADTAGTAPPTHDALALTGGGDTARITLTGKAYTLRITRQGKLILTK